MTAVCGWSARLGKSNTTLLIIYPQQLHLSTEKIGNCLGGKFTTAIICLPTLNL
jgi:hypothetical protein